MKSISITACVIAAFAFRWAARASSDEPEAAPTPTADPMRGTMPGDVRDDNGLQMKFVWCPPGLFKMENKEHIADEDNEFVLTEPVAVKRTDQSDDDFHLNDEPRPQPQKTVNRPPVKVFLTKGYWLGKYEVTQSEWKQVMQSEPWKGRETTQEGADFPATWVDWNDATKFCQELTRQEREAGRLSNAWEYALPTEAQWERACRARTETRFNFGNDERQIGEYAWTVDNTIVIGEDYPHQRGLKKPNAWGLHDMHGNVWEWCRDAYADPLPGGRDPFVPGKPGANRVLRGGGIYRAASECRSSFRHQRAANWRLYDLGFRVTLSVSDAK
jgi:formylglycine-generating enzyme required for sulfatase activity